MYVLKLDILFLYLSESADNTFDSINDNKFSTVKRLTL